MSISTGLYRIVISNILSKIDNKEFKIRILSLYMKLENQLY